MYLDTTKYSGDMGNHEKMHMWARDIIRIKNPLDTDFKFKYDSVWNTVKAGQTKDVERYLAEKFCWDIAQHIIGQMVATRGEEALEKYAKSHPDVLMDKYIENRQIWDKMPRLDDIELNTSIWKDCWQGVVEKYGADRDIPGEQASGNVNPNGSLAQKLAERFANVKVTEEAPTAPVVEPTAVVTDRATLESEVTA